MEESIVAYYNPETPNHPSSSLCSSSPDKTLIFIHHLKRKKKKNSKILNSFIITKTHLPFQSQP